MGADGVGLFEQRVAHAAIERVALFINRFIFQLLEVIDERAERQMDDPVHQLTLEFVGRADHKLLGYVARDLAK